jgi:predicted DNA-binding transcriptional regulator YafY
MRKAERLFQLLTFLRGRRQVATAQQIAETLEVSERTVYRDMQALMLSGVPIESETGIGYRLKKGYHLPPLMFDEEELQALLLGMRMVQGWSDTRMAKSAAQVLHKVEAILPEPLRDGLANETLIVPDFHFDPVIAERNQTIRMAIKRRQRLTLDYQRLDGFKSDRTVEPLGLVYWGKVWTMVAWCTLREGYRNFRVDRIESLNVLDQFFETTSEKNLQHYLDLVR